MKTREMATNPETSDLDSPWANAKHFLPQGRQDADWAYEAMTRLRAISYSPWQYRQQLTSKLTDNDLCMTG
ncbi:MAG: hypothetical protein OWU33_14880 [Firmicutes bacterium]|nr:hypothetical protein [Bacillota bacterium]